MLVVMTAILVCLVKFPLSLFCLAHLEGVASSVDCCCPRYKACSCAVLWKIKMCRYLLLISRIDRVQFSVSGRHIFLI